MRSPSDCSPALACSLVSTGVSDLADAESDDEVAVEALASAPLAWRWARDYSDKPDRVTLTAFRRYAAPSIVLTAVAGIADSCASDRPRRLRDLLEGAIAECAAMAARRARTSAVEVPPAPVAVPA